MAMKKITKGTTARRMTFHCQRWPAWASTMARVLSDPVISTTMTTVMPEGRLVGDHLGRGPHRAEQRVLRARRPAGQHDPVDADGRHGQQEQDAHGRVGQLQLEGVAGRW